MCRYDVVSENPESTVVAEYQPPDTPRSAACQSEAELEKAFLTLLQSQAYEYLPISTEAELVANLRRKLEELNDFAFTDAEWERFFKESIANPNRGIREKAAVIQDDPIQLLTRTDGSVKNIYLLDKEDIHNNKLQVINQYTPENGARENRYDVTILVNGLPLVHVELKRRGVDLREAFNQINRYARESFWAGSGLFEYVQIFVISNGTLTKYYSNTTRDNHIREGNGKNASKGKRSGNSFEFTSWWADARNRPICDLMDFGKTFFARHSLLSILTKYCVFTSEKQLLVMRPYQIVATERILDRIKLSTNYRQYGTLQAGGYIWHTTGSGKTLTSFKTAQLASRLPYIDKVLFVVDRKDLDYQTMKEYDRFEKGAANSNTSTAILKRQLENPNARIIITTIQKLSVFIKKQKNHEVYSRHFVIIFDECHRSQFGDMHKAITRTFKKYHIFGFTGPPITSKNAGSSGSPDLQTTEQAFGDMLHAYTIVNAISDRNVLPFRVEYISTMREKENIKDKKVSGIDREKALLDPARIRNITGYILEHFNQKTRRNDRSFDFSALTNVSAVASARDRGKVEEIKRKIRMTGFNSIFAVASIDAAKLYYSEFQRQMEADPVRRLKVALIYSFNVNEPEAEGFLDEENSEDTSRLDASSRDFLEAAIADYNAMFQTSYDTSAEKFQNYYKDVSLRMKNREIDLLIVVNMFLTGFDATTLNTLWVDKNLRYHGLLQAYSRTNRILNSIKTFGNIVCFRDLEEETNESIALFGNPDARGIVMLKSFDDYYNGYTDNKGEHVRGYCELVAELQTVYPLGAPIVGEEAQKAFIRLFGTILKVRNILAVFDRFAGMEILSERDRQDYQSIYLDFYHEYRQREKAAKDIINDDIVFEMELIKQIEINIDYILLLIRKYRDGQMQDKEIVISIAKAIDSSLELRNKKDLIEAFLASLTPNGDIDEEWRAFVAARKEEELARIIREENLNPEATREFMRNAFRDNFLQVNGTALAKVLPPVSRFTPTGDRARKRETVLEKLSAYFERFREIVSP